MQASKPTQVLLDVREGGGIRGFHLLAVASELVRLQTSAQFWALSGDNPDVSLALTLLRQESGQLIPRWDIEATAPRFDLYLVMSDVLPTDKRYADICRRARRILVGLMFPVGDSPRDPKLTVTSGHDTAAFARLAETQIRQRSGMLMMFRRVAHT